MLPLLSSRYPKLYDDSTQMLSITPECNCRHHHLGLISLVHQQIVVQCPVWVQLDMVKESASHVVSYSQKDARMESIVSFVTSANLARRKRDAKRRLRTDVLSDKYARPCQQELATGGEATSSRTILVQTPSFMRTD